MTLRCGWHPPDAGELALLSFDKTKSSEKTTHIWGDEIFTWDAKYGKLVKNLKIPDFKEVNPFA